MAESFLDGKVTLHRGDCLEVLPLLEESSVDSCVTDPPYHLTSIVKRFATVSAKDIEVARANPHRRTSSGFMGKQWDGGDIAFRPEVWAEVLRVLKPGGHLLAFSGTRTYHRMACAIEDAGFEIRDQIGWCYGSGFPKSHDVSKGIDRINGVEREVLGEVKGGGRMAGAGDYQTTDYGTGWHGVKITRPESESAIQWQGWGTALKPAWEPIVLARKPLSESSIAANVLKHGTGGINVDGCRVGTEILPAMVSGNTALMGGLSGNDKNGGAITPERSGRWPANLIHDGSEEVLAGFPETQSGSMNGVYKNTIMSNNRGERDGKEIHLQQQGDSGSAARFFYTAKADTDDRLGSRHPTVKPLDLMQYLVRLVTPRGGVVLDPFAGTGTTAEAAWREGMRAVLIERELEYGVDIVKRMGLCLSGPDERRALSTEQESYHGLPLFAGVGT